jgi:hypothetical protein
LAGRFSLQVMAWMSALLVAQCFWKVWHPLQMLSSG